MCLFLCTAWLASRLLLKNPLFISVSSALAVVLAEEIVRIVDQCENLMTVAYQKPRKHNIATHAYSYPSGFKLADLIAFRS